MNVSWKHYALLLKKKKRYEAQQFIVEGVRLCQEALLSGWEVEIAFVTEAFQQSPQWLSFDDTFRHRKIVCRTLQPQQFKRLAETDSPQGIVMVMRMPSVAAEKINFRKAAFVLLLEDIRDPGNMGTIIRTADWYGVNAIILSSDCVDPYNSKVLRSTMGSIFHLPVYTAQNLADEIRRLKEHRFWLVASSLTAKKVLRETYFKKPIAMILGSEAHGLSPEIQNLADLKIRIWKYGQAESLNVAIAGGVMMHYIAEQIF